MAYRRIRKIRRRRYGGVRKAFKKNTRGKVDLVYRPVRMGLHHFKRFGQPIVVSNSAGAMSLNDGGIGNCSTIVQNLDDFGTIQGGFSMQFQLNACQEYSDFTQLFDRYKITGVKLKFMYQANSISNNTFGSPSAPMPLLTYAFDADDAVAPPSRTSVQVKQYAREKLLNGNRPFSVYYKPRISKLVYNNALASAYTSSKPEWIDCGNVSVPHYGIKMWINNWLADAAQSNCKLTIQPIYYLSCRDTQ